MSYLVNFSALLRILELYMPPPLPWILIPTYGPRLHSTAQGYLDDVQARDLNCTHDTPYHRLTVIWLGLLHSYREM